MRIFTADIASGGQRHGVASLIMRIVIINELNVEFFFRVSPFINAMCGYSFQNFYKTFNIYGHVPFGSFIHHNRFYS